MTFVTRFAPSPSGLLHLGHAYSAFQVWGMSARFGGTALLRIEDIDRTRCKPEFEQAIYEDLHWLGLDWPTPVLRQSDRLEAYDRRLEQLIELGVVYRCFRSRKEVEDILNAPHGPYRSAESGLRLSPSEEEAALAEGKSFSWRLSLSEVRAHLGPMMTDLSYAEQIGDQIQSVPVAIDHFNHIILARRDIGTSYHLAAIHDDIDQGITHIIRGEDLRDAASLHTLLYALFGEAPPIYHHHRLITDDTGRRLAKRDQDQTLHALREQGETPQSLRQRLGLTD